MVFKREPDSYKKGILSDLDGAWTCLREAVVHAEPFPDQARLLFHIDEAMSWESVRDLSSMQATFLLIKNIAGQITLAEETKSWIEDIDRLLAEVLTSIKSGDQPLR